MTPLIGTAEVLVTAANSKLTVLKSQMIENLNRLGLKQTTKIKVN